MTDLTHIGTLLLAITTLLLDITSGFYINQWAVQVDDVLYADQVADRLANKHGYKNLGKIFDGFYLFEHPNILKRSLRKSLHHVRLKREPEVLWVEQQYVKKRVKRDLLKYNPHFRDPLYKDQWYLHAGSKDGYDMNVLPAWQKGYAGRNVVVTILDDGLETTHTDIQPNYDKEASHDFNSNDDDPMPRYNFSDENRHGTRCAGEVAAAANNTKCGVGIAYKARIGGVRMLDGDVTDAVEAKSLSLNPQHIDIYSASWGPDDNGKVVDGPSFMAKKAFVDGVTKGRGGKGSIFIWASGNGGNNKDSCNCDGYTNSIYTLSISSVTEKELEPWYLEECSSTLASTFSSGGYNDRQIVTTDLHNRCTNTHTGTSASAPLAAGIAALALEANPSLTWRDMQYITLLAARPDIIKDPHNKWVVNGMGRKVSSRYGYGLMDAAAMVEYAERWTKVPPQHVCHSERDDRKTNIGGDGLKVEMHMYACEGTKDQHVVHAEHVQAKISLTYSRRGDVVIHLTSPNGTRSLLLPKRDMDGVNGGFSEWPFMSVHFWGENPKGKWILEIENHGSKENKGVLTDWELVVYGTDKQPIQLKPKPTAEPEAKHRGHADSSPKKGHHDESSHFNDVLDKNKEGASGSSEGGIYEWMFGSKTERPGSGTKTAPAEDCDLECLGDCTGSDPRDCLECKHYRDGQDGPCVASCKDGQYYASDKICHPCSMYCKTCRGPKETDCLSCETEEYFSEHDGTCVSDCSDGYFTDETVKSCKLCDDICATCEGSHDNCTSCKDKMELIDATCTASCLSDEYRDEEKKCQRCHPDCYSCAGPYVTDCITCSHFYYYQNGTCVRHCGTGFYEDDSGQQRQCLRCHSSCSKCSGPRDDQCTQCSGELQLQDDRCVPKTAEMVTCAPGQYKNQDGCSSCDPTCLTCSGQEDYQCLTCMENRYLSKGECVVECSQGYYPFVSHDEDGSEFRECRKCHVNCKSCNGSHATDCTSCIQGRHLVGGECATECPQGQYSDSTNHCHPCHGSCKECLGGSDRDCVLCEFSKYLLNGQCVDHCPDLYFHTPEGDCHKCHPSCKTCLDEGPEDCESCNAGSYLRMGVCHKQPECDDNEYFDNVIEECLPCDKTCQSCDGPGEYHCLSCVAPRTQGGHGHKCVLCCTNTLTHDCCHCDPNTGKCLNSNSTTISATVSPSTKLRSNTVTTVLPTTTTTVAPTTSSSPSTTKTTPTTTTTTTASPKITTTTTTPATPTTKTTTTTTTTTATSPTTTTTATTTTATTTTTTATSTVTTTTTTEPTTTTITETSPTTTTVTSTPSTLATSTPTSTTLVTSTPSTTTRITPISTVPFTTVTTTTGKTTSVPPTTTVTSTTTTTNMAKPTPKSTSVSPALASPHPQEPSTNSAVDKTQDWDWRLKHVHFSEVVTTDVGFIILAICSCAGAVILFFIVFGVLQVVNNTSNSKERVEYTSIPLEELETGVD